MMTITTENCVSLVINDRPPATKMSFGNSIVKRLKPTQRDCVDTLLPARCSTIDSPTGSGKSVSIMVIADQRLRLDTSRLALICVPQTQIADNFTDVTYVWGRNNCTLTTRRFCGDGPDVVKSSRVQELLKWLRRDHALYSSDRAAIVSHAGLVRLWAALDVEQRIDVFASVDLYVDEAHHVDAVSTEDANLLGQVIKSAVAAETFTSVMLITATMFRGDVTPLLSQEELSVFTRWQLSWEDNFKEMQWLRRFDMSYVFGDNWQQTVDHVITSARKKDIVYLPPANSNLSMIAGGKYEGVKNVLETYRMMLGADSTVTYTDEGIHIVKSMDGKQVLRILDLVTERDRSKKKAYFNRMRSATSTEPKWGREMLDVVITLNMMKEGADWIWAERIVLMGKRDSFVDQLQILGRLLRDAPGKTSVELANVLIRPYDEDNLQARVNHQVNNLLRAMILETIMAPSCLTLQGVGRYAGERRNWLVETIPNADDRMRVLEKVVDWLAATYVAVDDAEAMHEAFGAAVSEIVQTVTGQKLDTDPQTSVARVVMRMLVEDSHIPTGSEGNLDLVDCVDFAGFLSLTARCGVDTLAKLKKMLNPNSEFLPYHIAREMAVAKKFSSHYEYGAAVRSGALPGCPYSPWSVYEKSGWQNWGVFLGKEIKDFLPLEEARAAVVALGVTSVKDYADAVKDGRLPRGPRVPGKYYAESGWVSWADYTGTTIPTWSNIKKTVAALENQTAVGYRHAVRDGLLPGCPSKPELQYGEWSGWDDFFGRVKVVTVSYTTAKEMAKDAGATTAKEYCALCKAGKLPGCPWAPDLIYKTSGWISWGMFLRNEPPKEVTVYLGATYTEFAARVRATEVNSKEQFRRAVRTGSLHDLTMFPEIMYKNDGWVSWLRLFEKDVFASFDELKARVREQNVRSWLHYRDLYKKGLLGSDAPSQPNAHYKNSGWVGWRQFLGTDKAKNANTRPTSKSVVEKPGKDRFSVKRYSTSHDDVRP